MVILLMSPLVAAADRGRGIRRAVLVAMQEDVAFNPSIGAVEIQDVVTAAGEHVVDHLEDRPPGRWPPVKSSTSLYPFTAPNQQWRMMPRPPAFTPIVP